MSRMPEEEARPMEGRYTDPKGRQRCHCNDALAEGRLAQVKGIGKGMESAGRRRITGPGVY